MGLCILRPDNGQARPYDIWYTMALLPKDLWFRRFQSFPPQTGWLPVPLSSLLCSVNVYHDPFIRLQFQ